MRLGSEEVSQGTPGQLQVLVALGSIRGPGRREGVVQEVPEKVTGLPEVPGRVRDVEAEINPADDKLPCNPVINLERLGWKLPVDGEVGPLSGEQVVLHLTNCSCHVPLRILIPDNLRVLGDGVEEMESSLWGLCHCLTEYGGQELTEQDLDARARELVGAEFGQDFGRLVTNEGLNVARAKEVH